MKEQNKNEELLNQLSGDIEELEEYIKEFSEFLPMPVFLTTPVFTFLEINNAFRNATGYDELAIVGKSADLIFQDKAKVKEIFNRLKKGEAVRGETLSVVTDSGTEIIASLSGGMRTDSKGQKIGYFFAMADITELKKLQDNLEDKVKERTADFEQEKNRTASILSNLLDPVVVVDNEGKVIFVNAPAREVLKLRNDVLGKDIEPEGDGFLFDNFKNFVGANFNSNVVKKDEKGRVLVEEVVVIGDNNSHEKTSTFSFSTSGEDDGKIIYKVLTAPVADQDGNSLGKMKIFYDMTREKMLDKMKSEFISIAAHQLRTPLSASKWAVKLVLDGDMGKINKEQKELLEKGYRSNERVIELVNNMLSVSRIEEGKFGYVFKPEDVERLISEALEGFQSQIEASKIKISLDIRTEVPIVEVDKEKMLLAIQNLIENAVNYTPQFGTIEIIVEKAGENLKFTIKDNGVGIPDEEKGKIFQKFFRASNVIKMQTEGTGLGLFIVRNIIEKHGGKISYESREGKGSEFSFEIPIFHSGK